MDVIVQRPALDPHDFQTVRQLYGEAQQWARHYEAMVVNGNVLIISASLMFLGLAFSDKVAEPIRILVLSVPVAMSIIGLLLTNTLFKLYATTIKRMIRLENILGCYDGSRFGDVDGEGSLLPEFLMATTIVKPASVRFFIHLYGGVLLPAYLALQAFQLL